MSRPARLSAAYGLTPGAGCGARALEVQRHDLDQAAEADRRARSARPSGRCFFRLIRGSFGFPCQAGCTTGASAVLVRAAIVFQTL